MANEDKEFMNEDPALPNAGATWPPPPAIPAQTLADPALQLRPHNLVTLLLLTLITGTGYLFYWAYRQAKIVNSIVPSRPVVAPLIIIVGVATVGSSLWDIFSGRKDFPGERNVDLFLAVLSLWCAFNLSAGLNKVFGINSASKLRFRKLWTFFFEFFYIQYKINKNLKIRRDEPFSV